MTLHTLERYYVHGISYINICGYFFIFICDYIKVRKLSYIYKYISIYTPDISHSSRVSCVVRWRTSCYLETRTIRSRLHSGLVLTGGLWTSSKTSRSLQIASPHKVTPKGTTIVRSQTTLDLQCSIQFKYIYSSIH